MSYASAQANRPPNGKGISLTIGVHVVIVAGVMALPGIELPERLPTVLETTFIEEEKKPPKPTVETKKPEIEVPRETRFVRPDPLVPDLPTERKIEPTEFTSLGDDLVLGGLELGDSIPTEPLEKIDPVPDPVIVEAKLNTRYASQFQPSYPTARVRMEQEGVVSVRVLVGINGRAKKIELISSPHKDFWDSTRKHALKKWKFKPATKDGKPYEAWITLKVRFELNA